MTQKLFEDGLSTVTELQGKTVEELLLYVGDEEKGFKPEAMEILLRMGLAANYEIYEQAVRNDHDADLRNSAMEMLVKFGKQSISRLVKLLTDDNEEVRNFSCVMLGDIGSREPVGPLIRALADPDTNVSHSAAEALGKIGDRAALMPLIDLLKGEEFWLQYAAINAIGEMRDHRAVPHLLELLGNDLLVVPVTEALGKIGDPRTVQPLANLLPRVEPEVAAVLAKAVVSIYKSLNETLSFKNSVAEYSHPEQLKQIVGGAGVEKLRQLLRGQGDRGAVEAAITLLGWIGDIEALDDFFALLEDDYFIKPVEVAILAVGRPAVERLLPALRNGNPNVRVVAIRSLRWMGVECDTGVLMELLKSTHDTILLETLQTVQGINGETILAALYPLVDHESEEIRHKAIEVLGEYPFGMLQNFLNTLMSSDPERRCRLAMILGRLHGGGDPQLVKRLLHDEAQEVRRASIRTAGLQQLKDTLPLLLECLSDPDESLREEAVRAIAEFRAPLLLHHLLDLLGTSGEALDYAVIKGIGVIGSVDGGAALADFLERGGVSRRVEFAALETLGKIAYKPSSELIANRYLKHQDPDIRRLAVETLASLGDQNSLAEVQIAVYDPHWSVRIAALHVLGRIGGTREIRLIVQAVSDEDPMVRKHAIMTLGDLRDVSTIPELVKQLTDMEMSRHAFEAILKFGRICLPWLHRWMKRDYSLEVRERVIDLIGKIGDRKSVEPLMDLLQDPSPTIRLAAIDSLVFCFDSTLLKRLATIKKNDTNAEVKERADLALKTFSMEKFF